MQYFAGIDWGSAEHAACVVDEQGQVVERFTVKHTAAGLEVLHCRLSKLDAPAAIRIAIERPSGLVVDTLVELGYGVVPIHPNAVKAFRPRYRAAAGKNDLGDAYLLADVLRTDGHRLPSLKPHSDAIKALRALTRTRDDMMAQRRALANQLLALLQSFWPGATEIFADVESPIALAFLAKYPTPASAERLGEKRLGSFLRAHSYSGRRTPTELLERLRAAPKTCARELEAQAKGECVCMLVAVLERLVGEIRKISSRIEHDVAQLADGQIVMSFPRAGRINAAQILAEIGDERARFVSADHLAAEAGVVPVTYQSGKQLGVTFRWACNHRLRCALCTFADNSRHASDWAAAVYKQARARGCGHPHAVRILARAWLRVLWRAWVNRKPYELERHRAAARVTA